ncbi:MAG: response regulator, partial [Magnetococcales bacterium]|nr:response regulator [Magnetococcales bacterium]
DYVQAYAWLDLAASQGLGSCFRFAARFATVGGRRGVADGEVVVRRDARVLIVEAHDTGRRILAEMVSRLGCRAIVVADLPTALERLRVAEVESDPVNVVLLDGDLAERGGGDGIRALRDLPGLRRLPKIILLTGPGEETLLSAKEDPEGSPDGFLSKPILLEPLRTSLARWIEDGAAASTLEEEGAGMLVRLAGLRVLLVEDDLINQEVGRELLSEAGIEVALAGDGAEAVARVEGQAFDVVLMDMLMPVMDGCEATLHIRNRLGNRSLPIIAMTASSLIQDRQRCLDAGMNDHLSKPVVPAELWTMLAKWSGRGTVTSVSVAATTVGSDPGIGLASCREIDVSVGMKNVGGRVTTYRSVLGKYLKNQADACARMARFWTEGNFGEMERLAHTLKGSSALIGAQPVAELAKRLEWIAKSPHEATGLPGLLEDAARELGTLAGVIRAGLGPVDDGPVAAGDEADTGRIPEALAGLMREADELLRAFDSSVEQVVENMLPLARGMARKERIRGLRQCLADYDFDGCLERLRHWAREEWVTLAPEEPQDEA